MKDYLNIAKSLFKPVELVESIFSIDWQALKRNGVKLIMFDVDNTLVVSNDVDVPLRVKNLIDILRGNFEIALISNSLDKKRLDKIAKDLELDCFYFVAKPIPLVLSRIITNNFKLDPKQCAIIGDNWLSDILGGNILDCYTILVQKCDHVLFNSISFMRDTRSKIVDKIIND